VKNKQKNGFFLFFIGVCRAGSHLGVADSGSLAGCINFGAAERHVDHPKDPSQVQRRK